MTTWEELGSPLSYLRGNPLAGRDLLRLADIGPVNLRRLLATALTQKILVRESASRAALTTADQAFYREKSVAIILEKPSLRTRVSFELAAKRLGAQAIVLSGPDSAFSRDESVQDTTLVLERFVDAIVLRTFDQSKLVEMARWAHIPVINALSDDFHPCQVLADLLTIYERKGRLRGLKVAYLGDGNNMANSYLEAAALCGFDLALATPPGYEPRAEMLSWSQDVAQVACASVSLSNDPVAALDQADVVVTDTWASMGNEASRPQRLRDFAGFQVDEKAMSRAASGAIFLHCLPAHRGEEVSDAVMDSSASVIYDEAENRLHVQQTLLALVLAKS